MKTLELNQNNYLQILKKATNAFNVGKIIAYPTDTVYGLGCIANNFDAIEKIYHIKKRPKTNPLLVLVSDMKMAKNIFEILNEQEAFIHKQTEPTSFVLTPKSNCALSTAIAPAGSGIAVRIPNDQFLIDLISQIDFPITSTSLNISGKPIISDIKEINTQFKPGDIDLAINAGKLSNNPSKIFDLRDIDKIQKLR